MPANPSPVLTVWYIPKKPATMTADRPISWKATWQVRLLDSPALEQLIGVDGAHRKAGHRATDNTEDRPSPELLEGDL